MTSKYRGFTIAVKREKCLDGYSMLYWTVTRKSDGWLFEDSFVDTEDTVETLTQAMKYRIDDYFIHPEDYEDCPVCQEPHPCECDLDGWEDNDAE